MTHFPAGVLNLPTTTNKHGKANLLAPIQRVILVLARMQALDLKALGLQEVGNVTAAVLRARRRRYIYLRGGINAGETANKKGQGLILDRQFFAVVRRKGIRVPLKGAWLGRLIQPRTLTRVRETNQRVLFIVPHAPVGRGAAARLVWAHVAKACKAATEKGIVVVVMPDTNGIELADELLGLVGMRRVVSADVTALYVNEYVEVLDKGVDESVAGKATDHRGGLPWADLQLRDDVNTTAMRIPV